MSFINDNIHNIFHVTLTQLEQSLQVRHIAVFDLTSCQPNNKAEVLAANPLFDQIPLRNEQGEIIGIVERSQDTELVQGEEKPITEALLVAGDLSLSKLLPLMDKRSYYLVVDENAIKGLVTRSDLLKLPVRLLIFATITHLEMLMMEVIKLQGLTEEEVLQNLSSSPEADEFTPLLKTELSNMLKEIEEGVKFTATELQLRLKNKNLTGGRKKIVQDKVDRNRKGRTELNILEFTDIADKKVLLWKKCQYNKKELEADFKKIEELRNTMSHTGDYAWNQEQLVKFLEQWDLTQKWIKRFTDDLKLAPESVAPSQK